MGALKVSGVTSMLLLFLMSMHLSEAGRVLLDDEENPTMKNRLFSFTESKPTGSPPPGGHDPGTNVPSPNPGNGHAASTINQRNFAGHPTTENYSTKNKLSVLIESKNGPTPPGGHDPGTNIPSPNPGNGHAASTINQRNFAGHPTTENYSTKNKLSVLMESKNGPTPPDGHDPGTNIPSPNPGNGHAASTINQRNFAGHTTTENYSTKNKLSVLMESKKGPTPPDGHDPGTNIPSPNPGNGHAASTINQMNFAGHPTTENYSTKNKLSILMESKNGPTPPGGHDPGTNIPSPNPGNGHAASTINQRNFAGHTTTENYSTKNKLSVLMESKNGPTPPDGHDPGTNIPSPNPGNGHVASTINQRNFAGHPTTENYSTKNKLSVLMESKKGPTPPGIHDQRTNIPSPNPGNGHAASTINQRNFAGHTTTKNYSTKNKLSVLMESKKGPTPPDGPNGRTNNPGVAPPTSGHAASTINQRNFAGDLLHMRTLTSGFHC